MMEPPTSVPSLSPAEMQILVSRSGLVLNPGQVADLVLAWRQVAVLIGSIPRDRPFVDDLAISFRLPPPTPPPGTGPGPGKKVPEKVSEKVLAKVPASVARKPARTPPADKATTPRPASASRAVPAKTTRGR